MRWLTIISRCVLALFFVGGGINHFVGAEFYLRMMPPYVPWHEAFVVVSGVAEIVLGVLLLLPKTVRLAAWGLVALLVAVFPANVHMALHPELFTDFEPTFLWVRLPLQGVLILWVLFHARRPVNRAA